MAKRKKAKRRSVQTRSATNESGRRFASIYPGVPPEGHPTEGFELDAELVRCVLDLEKELDLPVWLLIQSRPNSPEDDPWTDSFNVLGNMVANEFFAARHDSLVRGQRIALLIDSPGGHAGASYEMATLLQRHCGGFVAVIPRRAKSAATLLTLGADEIIMNTHAELGPLDVQLYDPDREESFSGLDEVQSLERLEAFAMECVDRLMLLLLQRTRKKTKTLLPYITEFVAQLTTPMFEGIDVVHYTQMSRLLRVAEEYGKRLLRAKYGRRADSIASSLVTKFPTHTFPIYPDELRGRDIGLEIADLTPRVSEILETLSRYLPNLNVIGKLVNGEGEP